MFRFLKISPQTLYAHLSQLELEALGIDVENESMQTKERIMDMVTKSLEHQDELDINRPLSVKISVTEEGMQILVTEFHPHDAHEVPSDLWDRIMEEMMEDEDFETDYVFAFADFEDVLQFVKDFPLDLAEILLSHLYTYEQKYYLALSFFQADSVDEIHDLLSLVQEFGKQVSITPYVLEEYGKLILEDAAIEELYDRFLSSETHHEKSN